VRSIVPEGVEDASASSLDDDDVLPDTAPSKDANMTLKR